MTVKKGTNEIVPNFGRLPCKKVHCRSSFFGVKGKKVNLMPVNLEKLKKAQKCSKFLRVEKYLRIKFDLLKRGASKYTD